MKISKQFIEKSARRLSEAKTDMSPSIHIELLDNNTAIVEGAKTILKYTETNISLSAGKLVINFEGSYLNMSSMNEESSVVRGRISGVYFT